MSYFLAKNMLSTILFTKDGKGLKVKKYRDENTRVNKCALNLC